MSVPSAERATRLTTGALVVLLGLAAGAPAPARAACGRYVVGHPGRTALDALATLEVLATEDGGPVGPAAPAPGRDLPCSGPSCSGGPGVPFAPAPLPPVVRADLWCWTTTTPSLSGPKLSGDLDDETHRHPRHLAGAVERPPRAVPPLSS